MVHHRIVAPISRTPTGVSLQSWRPTTARLRSAPRFGHYEDGQRLDAFYVICIITMYNSLCVSSGFHFHQQFPFALYSAFFQCLWRRSKVRWVLLYFYNYNVLFCTFPFLQVFIFTNNEHDFSSPCTQPPRVTKTMLSRMSVALAAIMGPWFYI